MTSQSPVAGGIQNITNPSIMSNGVKMKQNSNVGPRSHNYSPIMNNYDVGKNLKGLQSTLVNNSQAVSMKYVDQVIKDGNNSARLESSTKGEPTSDNPMENPSSLPEIPNNHSGRVFVPVPTSITIINNDNSVNNYNSYFMKNGASAKRMADSPSGRTHRRIMSVMPVEEHLAKRVLHGERGLAGGLSPLEKTITSAQLSPLPLAFNHSSLGSSAPTPGLGSIGSAGAVISG